MDQNQESRTIMVSSVASYMDKNKAIWLPNKAMAETVGDLKAAIAVVAKKAGRQQAPTTGDGEEKQQVRDDLETTVMEIADQAAALAAKTGNANLAARVALARSTVAKLSADDLEATAKRVSAAAAENLAALADYDITQDEVTALDALTEQFGKVKTGPRTAIAARAGETATLPDAISNTTAILRDRLDKQMTPFRRTHPEFYAGYQSARVIVNRGSAATTPPPTPPAPAPQPAGAGK